MTINGSSQCSATFIKQFVCPLFMLISIVSTPFLVIGGLSQLLAFFLPYKTREAASLPYLFSLIPYLLGKGSIVYVLYPQSGLSLSANAHSCLSLCIPYVQFL